MRLPKTVLKITTHRDGRSALLKLEGRVEGPWVEVLRKALMDATDGNADEQITLDLGRVDFADLQGRTLLIMIESKGISLTNLSGFVRRLLDHDGLQSHDKKGE